MKTTVETKRATITILERTPIPSKNDRIHVARIREFKVALDAARKVNDTAHVELYRREIQKHRSVLRRLRDQRFILEVTLKKPLNHKQKIEAFYAWDTHSRDNWKKFIKGAEDQVIAVGRRSNKHRAEFPHKIHTHFTTRWGTKDKGFTYHTEGNILKAHVQKNIKNLYDGKTPELPRRYIGIELEFCAPIKEENFAIKLFQAGIHKFAQLKQDGSLRPKEKETGFELAILLEESNFKKGLKTITDVLKEVKAISKDRRCGLHVHVDMRRRDKGLVYNNLVACQYALLSVVDPTRYNNEFCRIVGDRKFPTEFRGDRQERYKTINAAAYYKYKTLEVRMHEGSVNFTEISNWVDLILKITNYSKRLKDDVTKLSLLQRRMKLNKKLYNYALERSCTWQIQNNDHTQVMRGDIEQREGQREARLLQRDRAQQRRVAVPPATPTQTVADRLRNMVFDNPFAVPPTPPQHTAAVADTGIRTGMAIAAQDANTARWEVRMNTMTADIAGQMADDQAMRALLDGPEYQLDNEPPFVDDED